MQDETSSPDTAESRAEEEVDAPGAQPRTSAKSADAWREAAREDARRTAREDDGEAAQEAKAEDGHHVCPVAFCPIGLALSSMDRSGPDALEHMLAAGREVLLAAKAVLDARTSDVAKSPDLEKIEVR